MDRALDATPNLERRLSGLRRSLALFVTARGLGLALLVLVAWSAFAYVADYHLGVPRAIRIVHGVLFIALPLAVLWRLGLGLLGRLPGRRGLAAMLERSHSSNDLFTSATDFQLGGEHLSPASQPLIERTLRAADEAAAKLGSKLEVLDGRRPLAQLAGGLVALAVALGLAASNPDHTRIFADRLFGGSAAWPQLTFLTLDVPLDVGIERQGDVIRVRLARGEDLPISVLAEGQVPSAVELDFEDGTQRRLTLIGKQDTSGTFGTTLRSVASDLVFTATGGDDERRVQRVEVQVMTPPDLLGLALTVTPPAYSGLPKSVHFDRDVEVLAGSLVEVEARVEPAGATGSVRLLPEDRVLALEVGSFPTEEAPASLGFAFSPERSLRFRFELVDEDGLVNPDPGLWSVKVTEDRAPRFEIASPTSLTLETTSGGVLPLSYFVEDDFGVESARLLVSRRSASADTEPTPWPLELLPLDVTASPETRDRSVYGFAALRLAELAGEELEDGAGLSLELEARDTRAGEPNVGRSSTLTVRVLGPEDYMRRVQDRLASVRRRASELYDLQIEKQQRTAELSEVLLEEDAELTAALRLDLAAAATGQRRVAADASALTRELAILVGDVLHARIDSEADRQLEQLDLLLAATTERGFDPVLWETLVNHHQRGRLGAAGFAGHLIDILGLGLDLSETSAPVAREALDLTEELSSFEDLVLGLDEARLRQSENLVAIDALLERLAEWDNFQSVLSLTRTLLERQKAVEQRTRDLATQ